MMEEYRNQLSEKMSSFRKNTTNNHKATGGDADDEDNGGAVALYGTLHDDDDDDDFLDVRDTSYGAAPSPSPNKEDDAGLLESFPAVDHDRLPDVVDDASTVLCPGDHVYVWRRTGRLGMRRYQKHGIVLSVDGDDPDHGVTLVTFYHKNRRDAGAAAGADRPPGLLHSEDNNEEDQDHNNEEEDSKEENKSAQLQRTATVRTESLAAFKGGSGSHDDDDPQKKKDDRTLYKVNYDQGLAKRLLRRGGTVTSCRADERELVLARAKYLLDKPDPALPDFHLMAANGECAAVWCRIGRWCTLQGSSILYILFAGQAGGAAAGGLVATNLMLWAPMPGLWGSVGYIWYVPATVAFPLLTPLLIGFGLCSLVPLEVLRRYRKKWARISRDTNRDFWSKTTPDIRDEHYQTSLSSDEDGMSKFFGGAGGGEDESAGEEAYMPLDADGGPDDDEDEEETRKRMAAQYGASSQTQEQDKVLTGRERWQMVRGRVNNFISARRPTTTNVKAVDRDGERDSVRPLNEVR